MLVELVELVDIGEHLFAFVVSAYVKAWQKTLTERLLARLVADDAAVYPCVVNQVTVSEHRVHEYLLIEQLFANED